MADRMRVLVAESDRAASLAIAGALRAKGAEVMTANDAAHAMNMARKERPDAIVMSERLAGGGVPTSAHVAGNAILGANNIMRRHGSRLTEEQRSALLAIIEEQSKHLAQLP